MADPNPTIVFEADLPAVDADSFLNPDMHTENVDFGRMLRDAKKDQHVTFIPGLTPATSYYIKHGHQFTEHGMKAIYLKNTYGPNSANPILKIISES